MTGYITNVRNTSRICIVNHANYGYGVHAYRCFVRTWIYFSQSHRPNDICDGEEEEVEVEAINQVLYHSSQSHRPHDIPCSRMCRVDRDTDMHRLEWCN